MGIVIAWQCRLHTHLYQLGLSHTVDAECVLQSVPYARKYKHGTGHTCRLALGTTTDNVIHQYHHARHLRTIVERREPLHTYTRTLTHTHTPPQPPTDMLDTPCSIFQWQILWKTIHFLNIQSVFSVVLWTTYSFAAVINMLVHQGWHNSVTVTIGIVICKV